MAESLAAFARTAKRHDEDRFDEAIRHWEQDLEFLHDGYYVGRFGFGSAEHSDCRFRPPAVQALGGNSSQVGSPSAAATIARQVSLPEAEPTHPSLSSAGMKVACSDAGCNASP